MSEEQVRRIVQEMIRQSNIDVKAKRSFGPVTDIYSPMTAVSTQLGFFGVSPQNQPTTSSGGATTVIGSGTSVNFNSTFDGYTLAQVVRALRTLGILQ